MKIVVWNCNGGFRNKTKEIDKLNPDLLIIQECEDPSRSTNQYKIWAENYIWTGDSKNKGIGIFARNNSTIQKLDWSGSYKLQGINSKSASLSWTTEELKLFQPFILNNSIIILSVWTKGSDSEAFGYIGQFWKYLQIHKNELQNKKIMIVGDFNSNSIWDKKDRWWSHTDIVDELKEMDIHSLYHYQNKEEQGCEKIPTFYHRKNVQKSYHIDYTFLSENILSDYKLLIGKKEKWLEFSDHMPIILDEC